MLQLPAASRWISFSVPARAAAREWVRATGRWLGLSAAPARWERAFLAEADASPLEQRLRPLARRLHRQRALEFAPRALLYGVAVVFVVAAVGRLFSAPGLLWLGLVLGPIVTGVVLWQVMRRPIGPFEAARRTDASLALRERLATALELLDRQISGPIVERQVADATAAAGTIEAKAAFPFFAPGTEARRRAYRHAAYAVAGLVAIALLALTQFGPGATGADEAQPTNELAMADPGSRNDEIIRPSLTNGDGSPEAVGARSDRPDQVGDQTPGLAGSNPQAQQGANGQQGDSQQAGQQGQQAQQAQQDARSQQNANVAQRQQAMQDLGNALKQSQTAKQAADSLRGGDAQKGSQQLAQVADQVNKLSPGERRSLSQAFNQASQQIGDKDRTLADAAKRAADALSQFRNQDAQQAIKDAANEIRDTGQQAQQQRDLEQRAKDLQTGGQPQLPGQAGQQRQQGQQQGQQGQQNGLAGAQQNQSAQAGQQGQQGQQGQNSQLRSGGDQQSGDQSLSDLESSLRNGGLNGASGTQGAGSGEGGDPLSGAPHRLSVDARVVTVDAQEGEGPTQWRPPSPNAPPAPAPPPVTAAASGPASASPIGAAPDLNSVPWDLAGSVRQYFTPDPANAGAGATGSGTGAASSANSGSATSSTSSTSAGSAR